MSLTMDEAKLAQARTSIADTPIMSFLGLRPVAGDDPSTYVVEMDVTAQTLNLAGIPHGGAVATLIDHVGGFVAILLAGRGGSTADLHIRYLAAERSGTYRAVGSIVRDGGRLIVIDVRVTCGDTLVAIGDMTIAPRRPPS